MRCSKCGAENRQGARFCDKCGAKVSPNCPACGAENRFDAKFCDSCGAGLSGESISAADAKPEPLSRTERDAARVEGERRYLSVVFCDLVDSTGLSHHLDPEESRAIVLPYQRSAARVVEQFGGHVAKFLGHGVMALFGWPQAHEDDSERAIRAALSILEAIAALNRQSEGQQKLSARIGIHTGTAVIAAGGDSAPDVYGDASNLASRAQNEADSNTIVITASTEQVVAGRFVVESLGKKQLKGIDEPVELFRVIRPSGVQRHLATGAAKGLTPFVGREDELRTLTNRWELARKGEGQVVLIVGEAGIGKSRLVEQFRERVVGTPHSWIQTEFSPYLQNTPFAPIADMIQQAIGWNGEDSVEAKLTQLEQNLERVGLKPMEALPLVAPLLNLPVPEKYPPLQLSLEQQRKRLLATLTGWIFGMARLQPLVMVLHDLHWSDPSTLELQQVNVEQDATVPLLLVYTARPEFRAPWPMHAHHTQITLGRLREHDVREMVYAVAAKTVLTEQMVDAVASRSSGVPLFAEELTRAAVESGERGATGVPETLHNSLIARLDRLGPAREVAEMASVIGREFSYELLREVAPMPEHELRSGLGRLTDADLIYPRGIPPKVTYQFKHALIRDAAYDTLLKSHRKELHRQLALAIRKSFPALADAQPELLAQHWSEAGEAENAANAWRDAGRASGVRGFLKEAESSFRNAVSNLLTMPPSKLRDEKELEVLLDLWVVLNNTRGYGAPETAQVTARSRELAERVGDLDRVVLGMQGTWLVAVGRADWKECQAVADEIWQTASRAGTPSNMLYAYNGQQVTRYWRGDLTGSHEYFLRGVDYFAGQGRKFVEINPSNYSYESFCLWPMGYWDQARARMRQALGSEFVTGDASRIDTLLPRPAIPTARANAVMMSARVLCSLRDFKAAEAMALRALAMCEGFGMPALTAVCKSVLGTARAHLGDTAEGVSLAREAVKGLRDTVTLLGIAENLTWLAQAEALNREFDRAFLTIEEAIGENPEEGVNRPEAFRVRGELRSSVGRQTEAESDFREAIAMSKEMSAKLLELRATTSLARLLDKQGKRDEARAMLAEIYNWFTEGFDTVDLKDAKALLDELAHFSEVDRK